MSVSQILTTYDGQEPTLCITGGGGGGGVVSVGVGAGLTLTGTPTVNPTVNLGFTAPNQLVYGTGANSGAILGPGSNLDFLRINNSGNLEWHPISASGVVSVSANPGGACFVNNSNLSTPAVAIAFPAGDKGAIPASDGTGANLGAFLPGPTALQHNYILSADNMSAVGFSWKAAAGTAITGEAPLVEFIDGTLTKVGIDFAVGAGGIGQIPVGISNPTGRLGTLTPALAAADDGKVLTASSADAAIGGVAWKALTGPGGAIGTNAPLFDDYVAPNNTIGIDFTDAEGEIPYGIGTAKTGALLAAPTGSGAVGKVLTYTGVVQGQPALSWTTPSTPSGEDTIIVRSSAQANLVPVPTDQNTQLVLVAEDLAASWDFYTQLPTIVTNYQPEFYFSSANGAKNYLVSAYDDGAHGRICDLWFVDGTQANAVLIGSFGFEIAGGSASTNAQIFTACNGNDPYTPATNYFAGTAFQDCIIIGGKFNRFYPETAPTPPISSPYGICVLNTTTDTISYIIYNAAGVVFGFTNGNDPVNDTTTTIRTIVPFPASALNWLQSVIPQTGVIAPGLLIGGTFDTLYQEDATGAGTNITGYSAMAVLYLTGGPPGAEIYFPPLADVIDLGFYINNAAGPSSQSQISKLLFSPTYDKFWVSGDALSYLIVNDTAGAVAIQPDANSYGFLVYQNPGILGGNAWAENLTGSSVIPPFNTQTTNDITFSSALVNHIILAGPQMAVVDITNPINYVWTQITAIAPSFEGWYNSILTNIPVLTPTGTFTGDYVLNVDTLTGEQAIGYFTTATGTTYNVLPPNPTGIINGMPSGIFTNYFRTAPNSLNISGPKGEYIYDATIHPNISFTTTPPMFFRDPTGATNRTTATFSGDYQSQTYIASTNKTYWIQQGQTNPNLVYS